MKKMIAIALLMLLTTAASVQAAEIAIVHSMRAISESKAGQQINDEIKKKQAAYESEVKSQQQKVQSLQNRLKQMRTQYQSGMIKEEQFRKTQQELASAGAQLNVLGEMSSVNFKKDIKKLQAPIYKLFSDVLAEYAREKGYDAVFDVARGGVAFGSKSIDITDIIIKEMDNRWKK